MGNIYKRTSIKEVDTSTINPLTFRDYTPSLIKTMDTDEYGFYHSKGKRVILSDYVRKTHVYIKDGQIKSEGNRTHHDVESFIVDGLQTLVLSPSEIQDGKIPCVVICLGGPFCKIPELTCPRSIYMKLVDAGFYVIVPLRRGTLTNDDKWARSLRGNYGKLDVEDILRGTNYVLNSVTDIDRESVFLYGASYGGYTAQLIAGKHNQNKLYKAIVSHCGIFNLEHYPWHCMANPTEIMMEYANTTDFCTFIERIKTINPASYYHEWRCPILLIHTLDDTSCWFGQSVEAYNAALNIGVAVSLILAPGPHSYDIKNGEILIDSIVKFFINNS